MASIASVAFRSISAVARHCGLISFHLNTAPFHLSASGGQALYSFLCAAAIGVAIISAQWFNFVAHAPEAHSYTMNAVIVLDTVFGTVRTVLLYVLLLWKRDSLMENICRGHRIWADLQAFCQKNVVDVDNVDSMTVGHKNRDRNANISDFAVGDNDLLSLDQQGHRMVHLKLITVSVQFIIVGMMLYVHLHVKSHRSVLDHCIVGFIVVCTKGLTVVLSCMYATALIVILHLMRCINTPLEQCMQRVRAMQAETMRRAYAGKANSTRRNALGNAMRVQDYCDLSDRMDALSALYGCVVEFLRAMGDVFAVHVLLTLMNAFLSALLQLLFIYFDIKLWGSCGTTLPLPSSSSCDGLHFRDAMCYDGLLFGFHGLEVVAIVWLTYGVQKEGQRIGLALYEVALDMDERLTESVWLLFCGWTVVR